MSAICENGNRIFEIAAEVIPNLPLLIDPAFLALVLPAAIAPLLVKGAGDEVAGTDAGASPNESCGSDDV